MSGGAMEYFDNIYSLYKSLAWLGFMLILLVFGGLLQLVGIIDIHNGDFHRLDNGAFMNISRTMMLQKFPKGVFSLHPDDFQMKELITEPHCQAYAITGKMEKDESESAKKAMRFWNTGKMEKNRPESMIYYKFVVVYKHPFPDNREKRKEIKKYRDKLNEYQANIKNYEFSDVQIEFRDH